MSYSGRSCSHVLTVKTRPEGRHTMRKPGFCLKYENATKREEFWAELFLEGATYYNAWI